MIVCLGSDACADDSQWRYLDTIIGKVEENWHHWEVTEPDVIEESGWLDGRGRQWMRELFQKAALSSSYPRNSIYPRRRLRVTTGDGPDALPPRKAAELATMPLTILMENRFTDGIFLDAVVAVLAPEPLRAQLHLAPASIVHDSPGGNGGLPKLITDYADKARAAGLPPRIIVFTDGDGSVPGTMSDDARRVGDACMEAGVPCHVLAKRCIENYIPDAVLEAWLPNENMGKRQVVEAIKRLGPLQRDFYPLKKGLHLDAGVSTLYENVSAQDLHSAPIPREDIELNSPKK
ncbi:MAG: hypothetical protein KJ558_13170 [Gammaproteobacteria bacterium]|nr:hypothetical protein [Gammaproteobacteria bacterium]MBU1655750.1 hypothetical protein [Gammaproteobacteria bacterium]MBU1961810.1 hypothetical protein [Gammaproteobacteria bacterium]